MDDPLDPVRRDPRFWAVQEARTRQTARARVARRTFRAYTLCFIMATASAAILGGLVLYGLDPQAATREVAASTETTLSASASLQSFVSSPRVRTALIVIQAIAVAMAAFCGYVLPRRGLAARWLAARAQAENGRIELGRLAFEIGHESGPDAFRAGAHYVLKELVDEQITFFARAASRHDARAFAGLMLGGAVFAIAAAAPLLGLTGLPTLILLGALVAVVTPAFTAGLRSWAEATGDEARAILHRETLEQLEAIGSRRGELLAAVNTGDLAGARAYFDEVVEILRTDHARFQEIARPRDAA